VRIGTATRIRRSWCALPAILAIAANAGAAPEVEWHAHWPKVGAAEYALTATALLGSGAIFLFVDTPTDGYGKGLLYDRAVREQLVASDRSGRDLARTVGDFGYRSLLVFPFADAAITAWAVHGNTEVAWQMFSISAEAMALAGFAGIATDHLIGRARPSHQPCQQDPEYERFCNESDAFSSFISGHTAVATAGAAVTCAHHLNMPLYGGGAADVGACVGASALAVTTGVARLVNDRHWATDVTFAWGIGAVSGFVLPSLLHYRSPRGAVEQPDDDAALRFGFAPLVSRDELGVSFYGLY
jgi:membrane-associated phospholipid phosphatase